MEWLWSEAQGEGTAQELFDFTYAKYAADNPFWRVLPGDPTPARQFDVAVYDRGAMTVHSLRLAVGDATFFRIVRQWVAERRHSTGTTEQFVALAQRTSGRDLQALFKTWLFTPSKPVLSGPAAAVRVAQPREPKSWAAIQQTHELLHGH
jgi:aminopeptidase N